LKNKYSRNIITSNNENQDEQSFDSNNVALPSTSMKNNFVSNIWICDSEACGHYCRFVDVLTDTREIDEVITIGNGDLMRATKLLNLNLR
jgi:hypothetical protein